MSELLSKKEIDFLLDRVFKLDELTKLEKYKEHDRDTFQSVLSLSEKLAQDYYLPHNAKADANEPQFDGEKVTTIEEVKTAWKAYAESGLLGCKNTYEEGGMQLPNLVYTACTSYFAGANPSTLAYSFLTEAAANVIRAFGNEKQKFLYMQNMYTGKFAGTMALTEPDVGSSLGDLTTSAEKQEDGSYHISGQKIYISGGDQDITDNIVHLVLARVKGAPTGVKGISLFVVPKFQVNDDGSLGERNDVQLSGLFHKMGYRGTSSTILTFGENKNCKGFLLGEENHGLMYMFKMMNEARIGVGVGASMIGMRGYLASLKYSQERVQGRSPSEKNMESSPVAIIEHADVKRMLLAQKSHVEGSYALCLLASRLMDEYEAGEEEDSKILLDLLTPIVKSYPSQYGPLANDLAIQVLGGAGYTREFPVEQCYRDNRLNPIHEGTHGIQSLDLLGRKLWQHNGKGLEVLMGRVQATMHSVAQNELLQKLGEEFAFHLQKVSTTIAHLGQTMHTGKVDLALANSALFLDVMGRTVISWLWLEMADKAIHAYQHSESSEDINFMQGKIQTATYYIRWELPQIRHQLKLLDNLDGTCLEMQADWF